MFVQKLAIGKPAGLIQFAVEAQVLSAKQLCDIDDLSIMQRKMFYHLIDGLQTTDRVALNLEDGEQVGFGQRTENI